MCFEGYLAGRRAKDLTSNKHGFLSDPIFRYILEKQGLPFSFDKYCKLPDVVAVTEDAITSGDAPG